MRVTQQDRFEEYTSGMQTAFTGNSPESDFAVVTHDLVDRNEARQAVAEAHIGTDRKFGRVMVRGLKSEYSFDFTNRHVDCIDFEGSPTELAKEAIATAELYDY